MVDIEDNLYFLCFLLDLLYKIFVDLIFMI